MNEVTLYLLNTSLVKDKYDFVLSFIDKSRKEKAMKFVQEKDRLLSLGAAYLLKKYLPEGDIKETKSGKPYLEGGPYFNVSHSNALVTLALSYTRDVGVDAELIDESRVDAISYVLKGEEKKISDPKALFQIWSNKESLIKCISTGLKDIKSVDGLPLEGVRKVNNEAYFSKSSIYDGYSLSVTLKGDEPFNININHIDVLEE